MTGCCDRWSLAFGTNYCEQWQKLQPAQSDEDRHHDLADRNNEGLITSDERRELESIVSANNLLSALREEARIMLRERAA